MALIDAVIQLHNIAGQIEKEIGECQLSDDIRACGDRLDTLIKEDLINESNV
jgi:hypothetical protein